jgi:vacuolar-type H+-ATPase subunit I/STV1
LASFKLAEVFNQLAATSFESRGAGVLLGVLILLVGHGINFAMGIMGGVVHSLRLNVIEFFNWSLPEEGQRFEALVKKADNYVDNPRFFETFRDYMVQEGLECSPDPRPGTSTHCR